MVFAHDTETALLAAVALVNSAEDPDTLLTSADLAAFLDEHDYTGVRRGSSAELGAVRDLRPRLRRLLTGDRDTAAALVNDLLAEGHALPQLVRHSDHDWHVHAVAPDAPVATRIAVETAMAMIDVIRADEMSRLDVCADPDCRGLVLDLSRNRSRRFCSTTCGNRAAVAAYRARQR
ncbi:MAG: CGNR zinc finger domain-containing protein [Nocardioides sp.]